MISPNRSPLSMVFKLHIEYPFSIDYAGFESQHARIYGMLGSNSCSNPSTRDHWVVLLNDCLFLKSGFSVQYDAVSHQILFKQRSHQIFYQFK